MFDKSLIQQSKGLTKWLLLCIFLCAMPQRSMAQNDIQRKNHEDSQFKAEDFGFNAVDLQLEQKRFLYGDSVPYGMPIDSTKKKAFYDHVRVGTIWHYNKIHKNKYILYDHYRPTLNYGIFVEKELSKLHSLRLSFSAGSYQHISESPDLHTSRATVLNLCQLELMHSFNWVRFFGGYNPRRKVEAVTNFGIGSFCSAPNFFRNFSKDFSNSKQIETGPQLTMGAGVRLLLNPLFVLGIDPYVTLASDNIDHSGLRNHRKYDVLYGTDISLSYTFRNELSKEEFKKYRGKTLVDFGMGVQLQPFSGCLPASPTTTPLPFLETAGPQIRLGVGHWFSNAVAVRTTGNLSSSNWINTHLEADPSTLHPSYDIHSSNVLMNARLDLLFSPYRFFTSHGGNRFDVNTIIGWEYGRTIKSTYNEPVYLRTNYNGFSGGLQFRYIYDKHTSLYIEPRITSANYVIPYAPPYQNYAKHYRDYLCSVTAGMEFTANEYRFLNRKAQPSEFTPYMTLSLQGGPNYLFTTKEHVGDFYIDLSGGLASEVQLSPYSGVRVMVDYSQVSHRNVYNYTQIGLEEYFGRQRVLSDSALCIGRYGHINISADYVFDLGTLLQGYNKNNRWDVALAIGLVSSHRISYKAIISADEKLWEFRGDNPVATVPVVKHNAAKHAWGLQLGIPVSYRIAPHLHLQFEPRARWFGPNYIAPEYITGGSSKIINLQLGMKYTF